MTKPSNDLLTTSEGVDEGSAASTVEGGGSTAASGPGGQAAVAGGRGATPDATPAPPVDMESEESRAVRDAQGPGQQYEVGEG